MASINTRLLRQIVSEKIAKNINTKADNVIKKNFEEKKEQFFKDFDEHPVTIELNQASKNPMARSQFLPKGNLFTLIGFNAGEDPAQELRAYLQENIKLNLKSKKAKAVNGKIIVETQIQIPTLGEINKEMANRVPLEWTSGRAWTDLIQKGITGLGQFVAALLASPKPSRSGGGLQHPGKSEQLSGSVGPIKYINGLIKDFKDSIKGK